MSLRSATAEFLEAREWRFSTPDGILVITVQDAALEIGSCATMITLRTKETFSFFL